MKTALLYACALAGVFAGCKTTSQVKPPLDSYITNVHPNSVWLTRTDHTVVRMDGPRVFGDRVVGAVAGDYTEIPLADVTQMTARHRDKGKTVALLVAGGAAAAVAVVTLFKGGTNTPGPACNPNIDEC